MPQNVAVFVFVRDGDVQCLKVFANHQDAERFAIPYVAEQTSFRLTGDDNADWDEMNTGEIPEGFTWQLLYDVPVEQRSSLPA